MVLLLPFFTFLLSRLLQLLKEDVKLTFNDLYTILDILEGLTRLLCLHHPLFHDFFLNKD
jgi:hypothetical protein